MAQKSQLILAAELLKIKAVKLQPQEPFTWASGWKSPFYCDNRKTLSFPEVRTRVKLGLANLILEEFPEADTVAGVATGAIAQGALVAEELGKPFVYVRPKAKDHGLGNQIEGDIQPGAKVVVIEDLVSTGLSSLKAVDALRAAGVEVVGTAIAVESSDISFPNIIAIREGDDRAELKTLVEVLQSEEMVQWIKDTYGTAVVPTK